MEPDITFFTNVDCSLPNKKNTVFNFGEKVLQSPLNLKLRPLFLIFTFFFNMALIKTLLGAMYYVLQNIPPDTLMISEPAGKRTVQDASLCTIPSYTHTICFWVRHKLKGWVSISVLPDSQKNIG
jgi:hypothetical protein